MNEHYYRNIHINPDTSEHIDEELLRSWFPNMVAVQANKILIDEAVVKQVLEWIEAQHEPRMLGAADIINSLRQALRDKEK